MSFVTGWACSFKRLVFSSLLSLPFLAAAQTWNLYSGADSPGYGGYVRSTSNSPEGVNHQWIATEGGGVYKTTDSGATWAAKNKGISHLRATSIWLDTTGYTTSAPTYKVYVASTGGGVYRSLDNGENFTAANSGLACTYVRGLRLVSPTTSTSRMLASTDCFSSSGIYYSDNISSASPTWTLSTGLPSNIRVYGTTSISAGSTSYLLASTNQGIYKSTDSGLTWTALANSPSGPNGKIVYGVIQSYVSGASPELRLLATVEGAGVFKSDDQGVTWSSSVTGLPADVPPSPLSSVTDDRTGSSVFYISIDGKGIYRSTDRGATWSQFVGTDKLPGVRYITRYSATSSTASDKLVYWAATVAGPYISKDGGSTWTKGGTGLPMGVVVNVAIDSTGVAYAAARDAVYKLAKGGTSWSKLPNLPQVNQILMRNDVLFASTSSYGFFKLVTSGSTSSWQQVNTGLPSNLVYQTPSFRADANTTTGMYAALYGAGVYYFDGTSWSARNNGLAGDALKVRSLTTSADKILAATEAGLFITKNNGTSWTQLGPKTTTGSWIRPSRIAINPTDSNNIFVANFNTLANGDSSPGNGIYKTTDGGSSWTEVSYFKDRRMHDVRYISTRAGTFLVASSWDDVIATSTSGTGGVFASTDNGTTWQPANQGLNSTLVNSASSSLIEGVPTMISSLGGGVYYWGSANGLQGEFTSYQANSISTSNTVTYYAGYGFNDPNSTVTGVSLTKGTTTVQGTSATSSLGGKQWSAFMTLGTSVPTQATYTAAISGVPSKTISFTLPNAASTNGSVGMPNFPTAVYPNASSSVSSSSPLVISWTPPTSAPANTVYQIAVNSSNGNNLWTTFVPAGSTSSLTYGGSALTPSTNYQVQVTAQVVDVFSNVTFNASRIETFCYGCTSNLQPQTINLNVGTVGTVGVSMPVTASSSSNLAVSLSTGTPQVCAFSTTGTNNTLTFSSEGTCEVNASQAGNGTYQSASVRKTITVTKVDPTDPIGPGWTPLAAPGTPGYGGVIRSNYRSADGRLWVAVDGAGLYASSDEGVNWTPMNNGIVNKRAWGVYTEAANASGVYKVWAVTNGGGVYVSSDSGASFTAKNNGLTCTFLRSIRFVGTRVFVATDFCGDNNSGVFYSDNGGDTWTRSTGLGATALRVNSISNINPTSAITYLLANTSNGIYKSTDNGVSWAALPTSPSGPNGNIVYGTSYSYDASKTPALRLISTVEGAGIFVSDDAGATWVAKKTGMPSGSLVPMSSATSDGTANNWFVALDRFGLYRSTDRGESWTLMANDAVLPSPRFIAKYPASAAGYTFYAATLAGPYASADGVNWIKGGAGLPGGTVNNVVFDNAGVAYAGAADGAYRFDSETKQWVKLPGLPAMDQGHLLARGNDIYASTNSYGVYKLTNGTQWTPMNTGLPTNLVYKTPKLRNDLSVDNAFYAGLYGDGVYYFDGTTWSAKNGNITATNEKKVRFLTSSGPQVLMTSEGNMYLSTDRGANWTQVGPTDSTTNTKVRMLHATIDPQNPSVMFASAYNTDWTNQNLSTNGVWKTTDKGTTWTKITSDKLPPQKIYDVRVINTGDAYIVTAAAWDDDTKRGLWISQDGGNNWQQFSTGLGSAYPAGVFVTPNSQGYVASVGNGIYSFNSGSSNNDWRYFGTYIDRTPGANGSTYYNVSYGLDDPNKTFSALTLTNGSTSTAGQYDGKKWNVNLNLGSSAPAPSTTYTALLTPSGGGTPKAVNFSIGTQGWNTTAPTNLAVTTTSGGGSGGAATIITWSPPTNATANTTYNVALNDVSNNGYNQVWGIQLGLGAATSVTYSGPSLSSGKQYQVVVTAQSPDVIANIGYGASAAMAYTVGASTQLQPQSVSIIPVTAAAVVGASANLSATATSGLAVSFYSNSQLVCVVNGNTLNYIAPGLCSISAVQPGNATYQPASASLSLNVNNTQGLVTGNTPQTITFTPISSLSVGGTASLSATTTASGLSVSFNSQTPTTCAVSGSTVTGVNSGICALQATQSGNATYAPAVASQYLSVSAGSGSSTTSPTTTTTQVLNTSVSLSSGWNLMGNGFNFNIDVPQIFGNPSQFTTVWKWVTSTSKWAFYAPSLNADALATYAAGKGYDVLTTINPGEGFWVNSSAEQAVELRSDTTQVPAAFTSSNLAIGGPNELQSGSWNLVAIGDKKTPAQFNTSINPLAAPPSAGSSSIAENLTTLWAWDAPSAKWYFYAPRLQNTSSTALESYIASKNYLGFGTMQLSPSTGFWVNVP